MASGKSQQSVLRPQRRVVLRSLPSSRTITSLNHGAFPPLNLQFDDLIRPWTAHLDRRVTTRNAWILRPLARDRDVFTRPKAALQSVAASSSSSRLSLYLRPSARVRAAKA